MKSRRGPEYDGYEEDNGNGDELDYGSPRLLAYRMRQLEKRMAALEQVTQQRDKDLGDKFDGLVKALVGSVLTIAVLLTIYVLTQGGPSPG